MDRIKKYEQVVISALKAYINDASCNTKDVSWQLVADKENKHYQIIMMGWENSLFFHECPIHIDIIGDKIWIQQNMTEWDFGVLFEKSKIPKSDIILGFLSPATRALTEYAVA